MEHPANTTKQDSYCATSIRAFILDPHPLSRMGLQTLCDQEPDLEVAHATSSAREALDLLPRENVNVLITDLMLYDMHGLDFITAVRDKLPELPILILSLYDEDLFAERALQRGATGYLMKTAGPNEILDGIRRTSRQEVTVSNRQAALILNRLFQKKSSSVESPLRSLTRRELEIFELIGRGRSTRAIAQELFISPKTVETHQAHIRGKLKLANHHELLRAALCWANDLRPHPETPLSSPAPDPPERKPPRR